MKKTKLSLLFLILVLSIFSYNVSAQKKTSTKKVQTVSPVYLQTPFDNTLKQLPSIFRGHSINAVYNSLTKKNFEKDVYESTKAFEQRMLEVENSVLFGSIRMNSLLAISTIGVVNMEGGYNADTESLTMRPIFQTSPIDLLNVRENMFTVVIIGSQEKKSTYIGRNAFGVGKRISKSIYNEMGVHITNPKWLIDRSDPKNEYSFNIKLSPSRAKEARENMEMLFIGKLESPYHTKDEDEDEPTLDNPEHIITYTKYIVMKVQELWLYNKKTGNLYDKLILN